MDTRSKKKKYTFQVVSSASPRVKKKFVENQPTLLGSFLDLRMGHKVCAALIKLRDTLGYEKTIAICFKIEEEKIPKDVKSLSYTSANLVNLFVRECPPLPIMIIIVAGK